MTAGRLLRSLRDSFRARRQSLEQATEIETSPGDEYPAVQGEFVLPPGAVLGICCSGGGIRSASYNLGALQALRRAGVLEKARFLAAVSGGAYIAVAHAITAAPDAPIAATDTGASASVDPGTEGAPPPWAPRSPEEIHLRNNCDYLAPGLPGKTLALLITLFGLVQNLVPFVLTAFVIGRLAGWMLAAWTDGLQHGGSGRTTAPGWAWGIVAVLAAACVVSLAVRSWLEWVSWCPDAVYRAWSSLVYLFAVAAATAAAIAALPWLILRYRELGPTLAPAAGIGANNDEFIAGRFWVVIAVLVGALLVALVARRGPFPRVATLLAWVLGPALLGLPMLAWASAGASSGLEHDHFRWYVLGAFGIVLLFSLRHNVTWSMHPYYKERMSSVFTVRRTMRGHLVLGVEEIPYDEPVLFSHLRPGHGPATMPELIVCSALNVSGPSVPTGRAAASFTFTRERSGSVLTGWAPTENLERAARRGLVTLPAMMAMAGAAFSPSMGKKTHASLRFLMALFNFRLGVWIPNPMHQSDWELRDADGKYTRRGPVAWLRRRWEEPGALYLLREALGINFVTRRHVYVSDGGHWENLGLVELLRQGCTHVLCFDASGDRPGSFATLGEAVALASTELDVHVTIDPTPLRPDPDSGLSPTNNMPGTIRYPNGSEGRLVYSSAAVTADSPWDTQAFAKRDRRFPHHSTGDQFFDDFKFESYRALGYFTAVRAIETLTAPGAGT